MKDPYATLGVTKSATDAEIKAAYRKSALEWHPDRNKSPQAAEKFKEVTEAYEILSNPQKKQNFDQFGSTGGPNPFGGSGGFGGQQQGPFTYTYRTYGSGGGQNPFEGADFGGFSDPFEIFEQFFGGGFGAQSGRGKGRRQVYSLELTFMESVKGVQKTVNIGGATKTIKIPAGVANGQRVRFGDFDIQVSVAEDPRFQREGLDLFVEAEVSYPDAVLGTNVSVPTIDGIVSLKVPAGTQPDSMIRLKEKGVRSPQSGRIGNQYVKIKLVVPSKVTGEQKKLLEDLRESLGGTKKRSGWF